MLDIRKKKKREIGIETKMKNEKRISLIQSGLKLSKVELERVSMNKLQINVLESKHACKLA